MKEYSVYDNADGGYTITYRFFDLTLRRMMYKTYQAYNTEQMIRFTKDLQKKNFKFVGKL